MSGINPNERIVGCLLRYGWAEQGYNASKIDEFFFRRKEDKHLLMAQVEGEYSYNDKAIKDARCRNPFFSANYCGAAKDILERAVERFDGDIKGGLLSVIKEPISEGSGASELLLRWRHPEFAFYCMLGESLGVKEDVEREINGYVAALPKDDEQEIEAYRNCCTPEFRKTLAMAINEYDGKIIQILAELQQQDLMRYARKYKRQKSKKPINMP